MNEKKPGTGDIQISEGGPSDYVRLEADFFFDSYSASKPATVKTDSVKQRTVLVISQLKDLLNKVADDLQTDLGESATVLRASNRKSVLKFLKQGNVELVLYSPEAEYISGSSIMEALHSDGSYTLKSTLILLRKSDSELRSWVQHPAHSKYIMKAVNRFNERNREEV